MGVTSTSTLLQGRRGHHYTPLFRPIREEEIVVFNHIFYTLSS